MRAKHARQIRKGIKVAIADVNAAKSIGHGGMTHTARMTLTAGVLNSKLARYAHAEYTRRRVLKLNDDSTRTTD